jgi:hypothetical protein
MQRNLPMLYIEEDALTQAMITLASVHGRYGYGKIAVKLGDASR